MRFAIPLVDGRLCAHFGHCQSFALIDADLESKKILETQEVDSPPHEPGLLPRWLADRGANVIIAGGMGGRAQGLFAEHGINVIIGAPSEQPDKLVLAHLGGDLDTGDNICDH